MQGVDFFWIISALILVGMSITVFIKVNPKSMVGVAGFWLVAWLAQTFSPQLAIAGALLLGWILYLGDLSTIQGVAAVLYLLSLVLFLMVYRLGGQTKSVIDGAVKAALNRLGVSGDEQLSSNKAGGLPVGLRPFNYKSKNVVCIKNLAYDDGGTKHLCDIYQPKNKPEDPMPILIQVPGGAWITGSKDQQGLPLLNHMAALGWTCVTGNYGLGPETRFPGMLTDVLKLIAWVRDHAEEYDADPSFIAITGGSAGGHLITLAALIKDKTALQPGFETADTSISVAAPIYGRYDFLNRHQLIPGTGLEPFLTEKVMPEPLHSSRELWELASPESQVHADAPPFLIIHGSSDTLIPVQEAKAFADALAAVSEQAVDFVELPKAQHAFDIAKTSWSQPTVEALGRFFNGHYQHHLKVQQANNI